jgi:membrane-associated phospholipid phosphatase
MPLLILLAVAVAAGALAGLVTWRHPVRRRPSLAVPRQVSEAAGHRRGVRRLLAPRLDPESATGLALSLALLVIVAGGVVLGVLALLVRSDSDLVRLDADVARWGDHHDSGFAHTVIGAISDAGKPTSVVVLATVFGIAMLLRTRRWTVVWFLVCVVGGNAILTTAIKELVDRVRPSLNPVAATLGPSFPSGHSSASAAFLAAAALLLGRGLGPRRRPLLSATAVGLAVAVAASRVLLDEHWLSDVIAGLVLGWAWFAVCAIAFGGRLLRFGAAADIARRPSDPGGGRTRRRPAPGRVPGGG